MADVPTEPAPAADAAGTMRSAARGSLLNLVGAVISALSTFGLTVVVTRGVDKESAGVFFSLTSLFVIASAVGQIGTDAGLVYFISRAKTLGRLSLISAYLKAALRPVVIFSIGIAIAMYAFAPQIAGWASPGHAESATSSLRALSPFVPFAGLTSVTLSTTRGLGTMRPYTLVEQILRPGLQVLLALIIVVSGVSLNLSWAWSVPYFVGSAIGLLFMRHYFKSRVGTKQSQENRTAEFWRFTIPRSMAQVIQIAMQRLDIVLVAALAGVSAAAVYTAATRFIVLGQLARNAVSMAIQPYIASATATTDRRNLGYLFKASTGWLILTTWPIYLVLLLGGPSLLSVFGRGYEGGAWVLVLLASAMMIAALCGDVDVLLVMSGRTMQSLVNSIVALVLIFGLDIMLIPKYGVLGAAVGWSVAIVGKNLVALVQVGVTCRVTPFGFSSIVAALAGALSFGLVFWGGRIVGGVGVLGLLVGLVAACLCYSICLWTFRKPLALDSLRVSGANRKKFLRREGTSFLSKHRS